MVRSHGWQLPSNGFQVLAITVFFLLLPAFYAFLAPFLGKRIFEYASIAIYSRLALAVFILYIRCARINPADPGVIAKFDDEIIGPTNNNPRFQTNSFESRRSGTPFFPSSSRRSPDGDNSRHSAGQDAMIDIDGDPPRKTLSTCQVLRGKVHAVFAKEDCHKDDIAERQAGEQGNKIPCFVYGAKSSGLAIAWGGKIILHFSLLSSQVSFGLQLNLELVLLFLCSVLLIRKEQKARLWTNLEMVSLEHHLLLLWYV